MRLSAGGHYGRLAKKGGSPSVLDTVQNAPGLETLWQLHFEEGGDDSNTPDDYIANLDGRMTAF
jgi:hypothetical protein